MRFTRILPLVFLTSALLMGLLFAQTPQESLQAGIAAFEKKDWAAAREHFQKIAAIDPYNTTALYNWGLTELRAGQTGFAIALWRRALGVDSDYLPAQSALEWARQKVDQPFLPQQFSLWLTVEGRFLRHVPLAVFVVSAAVFLFFAGFFSLRYFGSRRRALLEEQPLPEFPWLAGLSSLFFVFLLVASIGKSFSDSTTRATIVATKVEARSTPDVSGTPLFELFEGLEVIVRQSNNDWYQVTYPGGQTGWVPKSSLFVTTVNGASL